MKKFMTLVFAVLFMMFVTSCGSDSKTEDKLPDTEVTDEDISDEDPTIDPTDEPTNPTDEPTNPTDEPTNPTDEPTNPTDEPTDPTDEPTNPTDEPTDPTDEPTNPTDEPTNPTDPTDNPTDPVETGSCTYIPNSFLSKWDDNQTPTGWVIKSDITSEKVAHDDGYALHVTKSGPTSNFYAFETPKFETEADAALPTKITFDLATNQISKMSVNIRCGAGENNDALFVYNWVDGAFIHNQVNNAYNPVNLGDTAFHNVELTIGEELTKEFWQNQKCRLEFKYGKNADFDVKVDNFVIHTAKGACEQEDDPIEENDDDVIPDNEQPDTEEPDSEQPDSEEPDSEQPDSEEPDNEQPDTEEPDSEQPDTEEPDQDSEQPDSDTPEPSVCNEIPNGNFGGTWSEAGIPENWTKGSNSTNMTFSQDANGAFHIQHTNGVTNNSDNKYAVHSPEIVVPADAELPAGIKFQLATNIPSLISINLHWGSGNTLNEDYYTYNWDESSKAFIKGSQNAYNRVDFGDTTLHDTEIIFGPEITEEFWRGKSFKIEIKYGNRYKDDGTNWQYYNFDISVKDFELVYYGGECNNVTDIPTVGWAAIKFPHTIAGYAGMSETLYGRVWIEGLTDQTVNKSVALMGVKAQCCYRPKDSDMLYTNCKDATVNIAENSEEGNAFGNNDEYKCDYPFDNVGEFEYIFQFTADNGKTWKKTTDFSSDGAFTAQGYANIIALPENQIPNGDFKYWSADGKNPQLWTYKDKAVFSQWDRGENNIALKVTATGNKKDVLVSSDFEVPEGKKATKITFEMATDQVVKPAFFVTCGTSVQYEWDSTNKYFKKGTKTNLIADFGDNNALHATSIQLEDGTGIGTCQIKFRIYNTSEEVWAAFDNFTVVYEDVE